MLKGIHDSSGCAGHRTRVYVVYIDTWIGSRVGSGRSGLPGITAKAPFSDVPIYLEHVPLTFEHSRPHFLHQHSKRSKKQEEKKKREKSHDWKHEYCRSQTAIGEEVPTWYRARWYYWKGIIASRDQRTGYEYSRVCKTM